MVDGFVIPRQWPVLAPIVRRQEPALPYATVSMDGAPLFYLGQSEAPPLNTLLLGALVALLAFGTVGFMMSHRWRQAELIVGSHHPSPSHLLGAAATAQPVGLAEVKVKPYPGKPPISPSFQFSSGAVVFSGALDTDSATLALISAAEIENAPAALWTLDRDHDGKLSAEECGLKIGPNVSPGLMARARLMFMRVHPVLAVLDANHDGEISASEIRNASAALRILDANGDGKLVLSELLPDPAIALAANIMMILDSNSDGRISQSERPSTIPVRYRELLDHADAGRKGFVTEEDLANAIRTEQR